MAAGRKKAVSLRLQVADIKRIKLISERLGVRDSEIIRYAIKALLFKLSPLADPAVKGRALVPLFLEGGADLVAQFELDVQRLGEILNGGVDNAEAISLDDLHLIAMTGGVGEVVSSPPVKPIGGAHAQANAQASAPAGAPTERRSNPMRRYLYDKYLYRTDGNSSGR